MLALSPYHNVPLGACTLFPFFLFHFPFHGRGWKIGDSA